MKNLQLKSSEKRILMDSSSRSNARTQETMTHYFLVFDFKFIESQLSRDLVQDSLRLQVFRCVANLVDNKKTPTTISGYCARC